MKKILLLPIVALILGVVSCSPKPKEDDKIHIIVLAGQSGARGKAKVSDLDEERSYPNEDVDIIADGLVMDRLGNIPDGINDSLYPDTLKTGFGDYSSEFGPELGIGETLASRYPKVGQDYKSVIVKYTASGSTFISDWYSQSSVNDSSISSLLNVSQLRETKDGESTGPLTSNLYQLIDHTIQTMEDMGYETVIDGMAFIHGEQDAKFDDNMKIYEKALTHFINDFRDYYENESLPVVITEALTNSAKYSNELRKIQNTVASSLENVSFITNQNLYPNEYEPWHFSADSNMEIGNRIAADIISYNDTRIIDSILEETINVPYGIEVELPQFVKAKYANYYQGYSKVEEYVSSYDPNSLGEQEVKFKVKTGEGEIEQTLKVNVSDKVAYIDGKVNEYKKKNPLPNDLGNVSIIKGENGLYIAAEINDSEIWTDGEKWREGDMGQKNENDDFRVYITSSDSSKRMTLALSAANLLRVYDNGISMSDDDITLSRNNLVFNHELDDFKYRVTTNDVVNDSSKDSKGMNLELYISYKDLGVTDPNSLKLCFNYNNISRNDNEKSAKDNYLVKANGEGKLEEIDSSYFSINELI